MDLKLLAREERADFADFLETLPPEAWTRPTLCDDWTVHKVVAHMISYDELSWPATAARMIRGGFRLDEANRIGVEEYVRRDPAELIAVLRAHLTPRGITAAFGGMIAFLDCTIHQQDIRRPLGMPREIPAERLRAALGCALKAPPIGAAKRARGLRLEATDVGWSHGGGPEVRGPGEALLLALAGRTAALSELSGPGAEILAGRM